MASHINRNSGGDRDWTMPIGGLILTVAVCLSYSPVLHSSFVIYDDYEYIYNNPRVLAGLSWENLRWAFTTLHAANYHPLTWLSHMADVTLWGLDAGWHHGVNLLLHLINSLLLYRFLQRVTKKTWHSLFVVALFALHPLHVESVAWVAERKDLLCTLFILLTLLAWHRYVLSPQRGSYLRALAFFACGLLAKPMIITLPVLLLFLDYWPLRRVTAGGGGGSLPIFFKLFREKIPFFALALAAAVMTIIAQKHGGAVQTFTAYPLAERLLNALASYGVYFVRIFLPMNLAVIYPHPGSALPWWQPAGGLVLLVGGCITGWRQRISRPWILVGFFWFVITLLPVIGIIQVGFQAMADRYTYLAYIGPFFMLVWLLPETLFSKGRPAAILLVAFGAVLLVLGILTFRQAGFWRDSFTLFERALAVTEKNFIALDHLGLAHMEKGENGKAVELFAKSIAINPGNYGAWSNRGTARLRLGKMEEAIEDLQQALAIKPDHGVSLNNLGLAFFLKGKYDDALDYYQRALAIDPLSAPLHRNIGAVYARKGMVPEAEVFFLRAIVLNPNNAEVHGDLGDLLRGQGKMEEARKHYEQSLRLKPDYQPARDGLRGIFTKS